MMLLWFNYFISECNQEVTIHRPNILTLMTMVAYFLTPINTSSEKRQLISECIKGPLVAAFRSPLMKVLDRSVETLGL